MTLILLVEPVILRFIQKCPHFFYRRIETMYEICLKILKNHCANTHKGKECKKGVAGTRMTKWPRLNLGRSSLCYSVRNRSY